MKVAIFGREFHEDFYDTLYKIFETLYRNNVEIFVFEKFLKFIGENLFFAPKDVQTFRSTLDIPKDLDIIISVGGDGTMLECVQYAVNTDTPVIGINSGRLGFLAVLCKDNFEEAFQKILNKQYNIEERTLIELYSSQNRFGDLNYALNEASVLKVNTSSMITIDVYLDNEFLNSYWADGLIIATPTGSTAYSLSAGGPILDPGSNCFVITPVSPHNLSIRPVVISDSSTIKLKVSGRERNFLAALDYKQVCFDFSEELILKKSNKKLKLIKLDNTDFFSTLRTKLLWGMDKRN